MDAGQKPTFIQDPAKLERVIVFYMFLLIEFGEVPTWQNFIKCGFWNLLKRGLTREEMWSFYLTWGKVFKQIH